jgi:hypothetical protein
MAYVPASHPFLGNFFVSDVNNESVSKQFSFARPALIAYRANHATVGNRLSARPRRPDSGREGASMAARVTGGLYV